MTKRPTQTEIENAFLPAREIDSPDRFAGRRSQVEGAYRALIASGANLAIVGNRGIGKTSLARQVLAIACGKTVLLDRLSIPHDGPLDFMPLYLACGETTKGYEHVLERLLTSQSCLADWIYDIPQAKKAVESYSPKFTAGFVGLESQKVTETAVQHAIVAHDVGTIFTNVVTAIVERKITRNGILIVIDEFDQLADPTGFAAFLKSLATNAPGVKFCIVGVAHDLRQLMKEHESSDRLFAGSIINMPPMSDSELTEIADIAEKSIDDAILFHVDAKRELVSLAQGHPYMVHLIGKYALRAAFLDGQAVISRDAITATLRTIAERGADLILEDRYKTAIASSPQREVVLRAMAGCQRPDGEIWTGDAYQLALDKGVDNASQYVGNLVTDAYGAELVNVRERYYRFKDSLFRAYVCARPAFFQAKSAKPT